VKKVKKGLQRFDFFQHVAYPEQIEGLKRWLVVVEEVVKLVTKCDVVVLIRVHD
jgi:hypothetical protein